MEQITANFERNDSVTLKRNAKGEAAWDIKIYFNDMEEDSEKVLDHIRDLDAMMKERLL